MSNKKNDYKEKRIINFQKICKNFDHNDISELIVSHKINASLFSKLKNASKDFLDISSQYDFSNMTPNGRLMPKKENEDLFNEIVEIYRDIIFSLNIDKYIKAWVIPSIRYKEKSINELNKSRSSRSELAHSDVWAGWGEDAILIQIPILGDTINNRVNFYSLPEDFNEEWMKRMEFDEGKKLIEKCRKIETDYQKGFVYICDISVIHSSYRNKKANSRMSIDIPLLTKSDAAYDKKFENDVIPQEIFKKLGSSYKLECVSRMDEINLNPVKIKKIFN